MSITGTNQWGPYTANTTTSPIYPPTAGVVAPATGTLTNLQSPSGSVTNQAATFNYAETETSTEEVLADVLQVQSPQQGVAALTAPVTLAGVSHVQQNTWQSSCTDNIK